MIELAYFLRQTKRALSAERLESFKLDATDSNLTTLARYFWNMALCEALYPSLQNLEVALRNSMHTSFSGSLGVRWFESAQILEPDDVFYVREAKERLEQKGKEQTPDQIVAELSFGFWTALFDSRYEQRLWVPHVKAIFPHAPRAKRFRAALAVDLHHLRTLRNRAFHHEPIWNRRNLRELHESAQALINWINPGLGAVNEAIDRFPTIHIAGYEPFVQSLEGCAQSFPEHGFGSQDDGD